jgi:muconolactone delta-isomerase
MEFLVRAATHLPPTLSPDEVAALRADERALAMQLRADGILKRLWRLPGQQGTLGLYETKDATHLHAVLSSLPLFPYLTVEVEALATHPQEMQPGVVDALPVSVSTNGGHLSGSADARA